MDFRSSKRTRSSSRRTVNDCSPKVSEHHPKGDADLKTENTQKKTGKRKVVRRLRSVQLANLVDDPKKPRTPCTTIGRKRVVGDTTVSRRPLFADVESGNNVNFSTPPARSPIPTMQRFGPSCPLRKKLLASRTPLTPAAHLTVLQSPMRESEIQLSAESPLERLPVELLVKHTLCRFV